MTRWINASFYLFIVTMAAAQTPSPELQVSINCGNAAAIQTRPLPSPGGIVAVLRVSSEDDHSKNSHLCNAKYQLMLMSVVGSAPRIVELLSSDGEYGRRLSARLTGFSQDGKRILGTLSDDDRHPFTTRFDYHTSNGKLQLLTPDEFPEVLDQDQWQLIGEDDVASVYVERAIYEGPGEGFYMHVRIHNKTGRELGIDLSDSSSTMYPNQWGIHPKPMRDQIDEERRAFVKIGPESQKKLIDGFRSGALKDVGSDLDYYATFNGKAVGAVPNGQYLIVSMDGALVFSDGSMVEALSLEWNERISNRETDVVMPPPIRHKDVPSGLTVRH